MKLTGEPVFIFSKKIYKNFFGGIITIILFGLFLLASPKITLLLPDNQEDFVFFNQNEQIFLNSTEKNSIKPPNFVLINQNSFQAVSPLTIFSPRALAILIEGIEYPEVRDDIIEYMVEPGDNLWFIADKFNISVDTIIWANDLRRTTIRPGQKLVILPVSGVRHIVREGDLISQIAEKYNVSAEKIIDFNNISDERAIFIGQSIIIPGGRKQTRTLVRTDIDITTLTPNQVRAKFSTNNYWGQSHSFPFGQCTWWVAQKRPIGRWGHAKSWLNNAERNGFQICRGRYCSPQVGAVIITRVNSPYGHVAYVEEVNGNRITYSEMNYIGWGRINRQVVEIGDYEIIGYIY
jgi:surface antigen